jgi:hypothetical protein
MKKVTENYQPQRSAFDQMMAKVYDPNDKGNLYHSAPWPMERTNFDSNLQQIWCSKCSSGGEIPPNPFVQQTSWSSPPY